MQTDNKAKIEQFVAKNLRTFFVDLLKQYRRKRRKLSPEEIKLLEKLEGKDYKLLAQVTLELMTEKARGFATNELSLMENVHICPAHLKMVTDATILKLNTRLAEELVATQSEPGTNPNLAAALDKVASEFEVAAKMQSKIVEAWYYERVAAIKKIESVKVRPKRAGTAFGA